MPPDPAVIDIDRDARTGPLRQPEYPATDSQAAAVGPSDRRQPPRLAHTDRPGTVVATLSQDPLAN
jgi:hypothetical protein